MRRLPFRMSFHRRKIRDEMVSGGSIFRPVFYTGLCLSFLQHSSFHTLSDSRSLPVLKRKSPEEEHSNPEKEERVTKEKRLLPTGKNRYGISSEAF